jgi:hypothetical protein
MQEITRIRHKRLNGEFITQEERRFLTTYYNRYAPCKLTIHVKEATRQTWMAEASAKGMSLGGWVEHRVALSLLPVTPELEATKRDAQQARDELVAMRKTVAKLAEENGRLSDNLAAVEQSLAVAVKELPGLLNQLPGRLAGVQA